LGILSPIRHSGARNVDPKEFRGNPTAIAECLTKAFENRDLGAFWTQALGNTLNVLTAASDVLDTYLGPNIYKTSNEANNPNAKNPTLPEVQDITSLSRA
jgi:DNA-binding phage protein